MVALLDAAGIRRALVLFLAYQFGNPNKPKVDDEYSRVQAENDWTAQQVSQFPDWLRASYPLGLGRLLRGRNDTGTSASGISGVPLSAAEFDAIDRNIAPYMR
jgi:hypothetical protein